MSNTGTVLLMMLGIAILLFSMSLIIAGVFVTGIILLLVSIILLAFSGLGVSQSISSYKIQKGLNDRSASGINSGFTKGFQDNSLRGSGSFNGAFYGRSSNSKIFRNQIPFAKRKPIGSGSLVMLAILLFLSTLFPAFIIFLVLFTLSITKKQIFGARKFPYQSNIVYSESDGLE